MGIIKPVQRVKLIIGEIYCDGGLIQSAESELSGLYGKIDSQSEEIPFDFTNYYEKEMGAGLIRRWITFDNPIMPDKLAEIKVKTNSIEENVSGGINRKINLDPGYISGSSLVLASTKNYSHRIYLNNGIYAEVTLIFEHGEWVPLRWTYPDYKTKTAFDFFSGVRKCLK